MLQVDFHLLWHRKRWIQLRYIAGSCWWYSVNRQTLRKDIVMFSIFTISVSKQVRGGEGGPSLYPSPVKKLVSTAGLAKSEVLTYHGANYKTTYFEWRKIFSTCHERRTKKKFWVPIKSRTSDHRIPIKKNFSKLTISIILFANMTLPTFLILAVCSTRVIWTS